MKKFILIINWSSGETNEYVYTSEEKAIEAENGFKKAFGNQVAWSGIKTKNFYE